MANNISFNTIVKLKRKLKISLLSSVIISRTGKQSKTYQLAAFFFELMPPEGPFLDSWHVDDGEMTLTFADRLWVMIMTHPQATFNFCL